MAGQGRGEGQAGLAAARAPAPGGGWAALLVVLAAVAASASTLRLGFSFDDYWLILDNPRVADWSYIRYLLIDRGSIWRPLEALSFLVDYRLWGPGRPWAFHLTNLLLHAAASGLLFALFLRLGATLRAATAGGLLFAVLPIHVEAVAAVAHRREPLALLFVLLAWHAWLSARGAEPPPGQVERRPGRAASRHWLARAALVACAGLAWVLGLLSKEVAAVMFPATVAIWELSVRPSTGRERRRLFGLLLLAAVLLLLGLGLHGDLGRLAARFDASHIGWLTRGATESYGRLLLASVKAFGTYARLIVWPWPLYVDRDFPVPTSPAEPGVLFGFVALGLWAGATAWALRRAPLAGFGLGWFGVNLVPVINLVPLTYWLFAERFAYLPTAGACLAAGIGFDYLASRVEGSGRVRLRRVPAIALGLVLAAQLLWGTRMSFVWLNDVTLWSHTLRYNPRSFRAWYNLGYQRHLKGDLAGAERCYRRVLEIDQRFPDAYLRLALITLNTGRYSEAIEMAGIYAEIKPEDPWPYRVLGGAYFHLGRPRLAAEAYRQALARDPADRQTRLNLEAAEQAMGAGQGTPLSGP